MVHHVVVGGGITGLAAAYALTRGSRDSSQQVTLVEAEERPGGKLRSSTFAGATVDLGPESFVAAVPEMKALCTALGLEEAIVAPSASKAAVWTRGRLRPFPDGLVHGVPTSAGAIARSGILSPGGIMRAGCDLFLPRTELPPDPTVTQVIAPRFGREVVERLVEPLLGGIHAGRADRLSMAAVAPHLATAAQRHRSLMQGLKAARAPKGTKAPSMLVSIAGGLERLIDRLLAALESVEVHTGTPVVSVTRQADGRYCVLCEHDITLVADDIMLAVPASEAAKILRAMAPELSSRLEALAYASVTTVLLAYATSAFPRPLDCSGFLVPRYEGKLLTACTVCTTKWPHIRAADMTIVRCSTGRWGDERALHLDDDALVEQIQHELTQALGVQERPRERIVTRWPQAIPQYETGHQARVAEIEAALTSWPGLVLTGASYHGVGLSSCVQDSARAVASLRLPHLQADQHSAVARSLMP